MIYMNTAKIAQYKYKFCHLRKGVTKHGAAPHKLILLLAVIREIEYERILQNRIEVTEALIDSFMTIWKENIHSGHSATFALPFYHLPAEGFWQLHAYPQWETWLTEQKSISSTSKLREVVQYATLESELFDLLLSPVARDSLKQVLFENLRNDDYGPIFSEQSKPVTEKNLDLFRRQKDLLDTFLSTGAISQAQHDKSLNCLIEKMRIKDY